MPRVGASGSAASMPVLVQVEVLLLCHVLVRVEVLLLCHVLV